MKRDIPAKATLRLEYVLCGKAKCKKWHGPYWYAYWQEAGARGVRTAKAYVGKKLPASIRNRRMKSKPRQRGSAHDARVVEELTPDEE